MTVCDISSYDCPFDLKIKGYHFHDEMNLNYILRTFDVGEQKIALRIFRG